MNTQEQELPLLRGSKLPSEGIKSTLNFNRAIFIDPTSNFLNKIPAKDRKKLKAIKLRIIRMVSPDGIVSVLLTNLYDREKFPRQEIITLYFKRWEV